MFPMINSATWLAILGSPHGKLYNRAFGVSLVLLGARFLYDAYRGSWQEGGITWRGEVKKARAFDRVMRSVVGFIALYGGFSFLSGGNPLGPNHPVFVNIFSGGIALALAGITFFGTYRIWMTGTIGAGGELIRAAWYHKVLFPALGLFFVAAAWVFLRRL